MGLFVNAKISKILLSHKMLLLFEEDALMEAQFKIFLLKIQMILNLKKIAFKMYQKISKFILKNLVKSMVKVLLQINILLFGIDQIYEKKHDYKEIIHS